MASIRTFRNPDGTPRGYEVRYRDPTGRLRGKSFRRKTDASAFATTIEGDKVTGAWVDPQLARSRFDDWAGEWLDTTHHLKPKTRHDYEVTLRNHVLPLLGARRVGEVDKLVMRRFVGDLLEAGAGAATVRNAVKVARLVLAVAVEGGALKANPAAAMRLPRSDRDEMHFLTAAQVERLSAELAAPYGLLVRFAAYTGLRAGEIGALKVKRLDLIGGRVSVAANLSDVNGRLIVVETKTYELRSVPIPMFLRGELLDHLGSLVAEPEALVFTAPQGGPLRHNLFYRRHYKPAVVRAGLDPGVRFHDLRHTCAALLISLGAHPKAIMEWLGHRSITVTLDRYGHLFPSLADGLVTGLDQLHDGAVSVGSGDACDSLAQAESKVSTEVAAHQSQSFTDER